MRARRVFLTVIAMVTLSTGVLAQPSSPRDHAAQTRLPWNDSRLVGSPEPPLPYKTRRAFPDLSILYPLAMMPEPGRNRLFVLLHENPGGGQGRLVAMPDRQDVTSNDAQTLLEIDGIAYGLAFHPRYEENGYIYLGLNGPMNGPKSTGVVRYTVDPNPPHRIDPQSAISIIAWPSDGHNGGDLAFGNDGYLYVSSGDGSGDSDTLLTGQSLDDLLAAVLRIDVDHPDPGRNYRVPPDNPFIDRPNARPELWAYGFRNPWKLSTDRETGQLWVGQNGQDLWEQVYLVERGGNYGWSLTEGSHVFQASRQAGPDPILPPTAEHHHSEARSLTGGHVYRGPSLPDLTGFYIYGDWSTGRVWAVQKDGDRVVGPRLLVDTPFNITGFGLDHDGEIYVIDQLGGAFHRLEPTTEADHPTQPFPTRLSETGLLESVPKNAPHPAAISYQVQAPQWADGASISRFAAFPGLDRIVQQPQPNAGGAWTLPNGSALAQTLTLDLIDEATGQPTRKRIETRILVRQQGEWAGYSYRWNDDQTDADLVPSAGDVAFLQVPDSSQAGGAREQVWRFPARTECLVCHSRAAGFVLGFSPLQLDLDQTSPNEPPVNQLARLEQLGLFEDDLKRRSADQRRLVDPYNPDAPLADRVKSYLHVNCSICHVAAGGGNSAMQLDLDTSWPQMRLIDETPRHDRFGIDDARLVAPGAPDRSVLHQRISRRLTGQMPPLGTTEIDQAAVQMVRDWIMSLPPQVER